MRKFLTVAILLCAMAVQSQNMELGLWGGVSLYQGDLSPYDPIDYIGEIEPGGGIFLRVNPVKPLSFRLGLSLGQVNAKDGETNPENAGRGLNFRTNITELALTAEWNIFRVGNPRGTQFAPYLYGGAALFRFNPETEFEGNWIELQPLGTEGQGLPGYEAPYDLTQLAIPLGGGIKFIFKERFTLGFEMAARKTFTDHLDDISSQSVNYLDVLEGNGSLAAQLSNPSIKDPEVENLIYTRGGEYDDWYFFGGVTLSFAFGEGSGVRGRGIGCPTF